MNENEIELQEVRAMIYLPEHTLEMTLDCKVWDGKDVVQVSKKLTMDEVQKAVQDAEENYAEDDDRYVITEKGRRYLEELEHGGFNITC